MATAATEQGFLNLRKSETHATEKIDYTDLIDGVRREFDSGKTKNLAWRKEQLQQIVKMCKENHQKMADAVHADHGGSKLRGLADPMAVFTDADMALKNLDKWAAPDRVSNNGSLIGKSEIRKEAKGIVLVIAPWNYPISLALQPLVSSIAAGNCCVIKPSEVSVNSSKVIRELVEEYLDNSCIKVVEGAVPETQALLDQKFDHIFYTGNGAVARIICAKAAKFLTPVSLELGGKSPVYVDKSAKMKATVNRISCAKWLNAGQTCVAPDYILVHKDREQELIDGLTGVLKENFGDNPQVGCDYGRVINERHVARVRGLIESSQGKVLVGGLDGIDAKDHFIPPTLLHGPALTDRIMQEEIFGPALPIITVSGEDEALKIIQQVCKDPLALYIFSENSKVTQKILNKTNSGGVTVNSAFEHLTNPSLPFGGVGNSGQGAYHGKFGFDEFTHHRSVLYKDTTFTSGMFLPLKGGDKLYNLAAKLTITGFLTDFQKLVAKVGLGAVLAAAAGVVYSRL